MRIAFLGAICAFGLGALGGCVSIPGTGLTSAADVARDAAALNDAYSRAASGQILLNALRSRDRWPRQYVTLTGISNQPTATIGGTLSLDPIPLGTSTPFDDSTAAFTRSHTSQYNYGITPMATADITSAVLNPVKRGVFAHYWDSRWARDVLLLVMAENMRRYTGTTLAQSDENWGRMPIAEVHALIDDDLDEAEWSDVWENSPTDDERADGDVCLPDLTYDGEGWPDDIDRTLNLEGPFETSHARAHAQKARRCVFFQVVHRMYEHSEQTRWSYVRLRALPAARCREISRARPTDANSRLIRSMAQATTASNGRLALREERTDPGVTPDEIVLARCPSEPEEPVLLEVVTRVMVNDQPREYVAATYLIRLRSLDEMIYAMGRLLRSQDVVPLAREEPCERTAGDANCVDAPLFAVQQSRVARTTQFAAFVDYQGDRYLAGPPVRAPTDHNTDRSATVLTLLTQLFALNFSPGAAGAAPSRAVVSQ